MAHVGVNIYEHTSKRYQDLLKQWSAFENAIRQCRDDENVQGYIRSFDSMEIPLNKIVDYLCEEDLENRKNHTIGECLEYFMSQNIFDILGSYTKSDRPRGFFRIGCRAITELIVCINSTSILSQKNIHHTLCMMLNSILLSIINKTELDAYKEEIVDLVFSICQRAYNEPYIVNLFFSNVKKLSTKKSERGEYLPLEILLSIMKEMKSNESNISYVQRCFHTFKIVMRTNSKPLDEYIMNESCLIEVVINKLVTLYKSMPETVTKKNKIHFKQAAIKKAKKQVDRKKLKKLKIPGEKIKIKKIKYKNKNQENLGIRNLIQIVYGESFGPLNGDQDISSIQICNFDAFMSFFCFFNDLIDCTINKVMVDNLIIQFFNNLLLEVVQPLLLTSEDFIVKRTCIQYLVHMVHLSNSSRVTRIIFFFLFGFPEGTENLEEEKSAVEEHHSKDEKEENKVEEDEYKIEEIDDMLDFMQNDQLFVHNGNYEDQDLFKLDEDFIIPKDDPLLADDPLLFEDPLPPDDPLFGSNIDEEMPMVRIGNQMMAGPQQTNNPEPEARRRDRGRDANKNSGKRGARSVSVLAIKDPKAELDVLASILDGVEKVEKEVKDNFEKEEEADFQVKIKTSKHLVGELSKSIVMGIISDEKYMSTVSLKLIEIFLKTRDKEVLEALVYRCIRYLSEDEPDDINICEYFEKEVLQNQEEVKIDPNKNCNSQNLSNLTTSDTENSETKEGERSLIKRFNSKLSLIQMTLNPKSDFFMFDDEFLESGLLFAVLLKKLSSMLNNPRIDNLILTEIWLQIGSLPVDRERPETFYLYAFCFQDISKLANSMSKIGLFASVESIHEQISKCNLGEDLDPLLFYRKKELKVIPEDSIPPLSSRTEEEYLNIISGKTNRIDAIMVFQEFLKEYTSLSHFQRWFIKMINKYDQVHQEDIEFDTLIQHL